VFHTRRYQPKITGKSFCLYNSLPTPLLKPLTPSFTPISILLIGRLVDDKGFDLALHAIYFLLKKNITLDITIAGVGFEHKSLENLVNDLGLNKITTFLGSVEQQTALELINTASIVVMPSRYEPFGLVALEAMQLAKPIIASRVGGLAEIIRHQDTGLLVTRNNIEEITNAMEYLITHPDEAIAMGQRARADVLERFSIEKMVDGYEQAYRDVIQLKKQENTVIASKLQ